MRPCEFDLSIGNPNHCNLRKFFAMSILNPSAVISTFHIPESPQLQVLSTSVGLLIASEALNFYLGSLVFGLIASLTPLVVGVRDASSKFDFLNVGALLAQENRFVVFLLLGLTLSVIGNVLLIPSKSNYNHSTKHKTSSAHSRLKRAKTFTSLGHIAYTLAFASSIDFSLKGDFRWADFGMTFAFGALSADWLGLFQKERQYDSWFEISKEMQWPVVVYWFLLIIMVSTANATDKGFQLIASAWLLLLSDLLVLTNAFGVEDEMTKDDRARKWKESMISSLGWTLYYLSQFLLVGCIY